MIISESDAVWAADEFIDYFKNFTNLEEYLRAVKKAVIDQSSPLVDPRDEFLMKIFIQMIWSLILG